MPDVTLTQDVPRWLWEWYEKHSKRTLTAIDRVILQALVEYHDRSEELRSFRREDEVTEGLRMVVVGPVEEKAKVKVARVSRKIEDWEWWGKI